MSRNKLIIYTQVCYTRGLALLFQEILSMSSISKEFLTKQFSKHTDREAREASWDGRLKNLCFSSSV